MVQDLLFPIPTFKPILINFFGIWTQLQIDKYIRYFNKEWLIILNNLPRDLQFKVDFEWWIFKKLFMTNLYLLTDFVPEIFEESFFFSLEMSDLRFESRSNV